MVIFDVPDGAGRPLATLHGFLGQASSFDDVLSGVRARIARGRLPGHSPDPWKSRACDLPGVADEIAEALPFEEPCVVLGYSMGARVTLAMTIRHPARVRCAVLVGVHPGLDTGPEREARLAWDDEQAALIERDGMERFVESWQRMPALTMHRAIPESRAARRLAERLAHRAADVALAMRLLGLGRMPPLASDLGEHGARVVIVTGALDEKFGAVARDLVARAPAITHRVVAGVGHDVGLEAPAELADIVGAALAC